MPQRQRRTGCDADATSMALPFFPDDGAVFFLVFHPFRDERNK
jgi:hypothetical protein